MRFVFGVTLAGAEAVERIVIAKMPKRLPIVLSREEVARLLHGASPENEGGSPLSASHASSSSSAFASLRSGVSTPSVNQP